MNLLLEKSARDDTGFRIKELLQNHASAENIFSELSNIIDNRAYRDEMLAQLSKIKELYEEKNATARVEEIVRELCIF